MRQGGAGLGLPLSRGFNEQMGGRFRLDSQPGRGTTVTLSLPAAAGRGEPGAAAHP